MNKFNKIIKSVISLAMAFVFMFGIACKPESDDTGGAVIKPKPPAETTISLNQTSYQMTVGGTVRLELKEYDISLENPITWESSNNSIAKVQQTNVSSVVEIEAMGEGDATITVTQGTATATCAISSSFGESSAEVVLSVADEFNIQANSAFDLNPKIQFNGKIYDDGEFTYTIADEDNFSIENGVLVGTTTQTSTEVTIKGTWRGKDSDDMRLLEKSVTVNVIDSVSLVIDGQYGQTTQLYTTAEFAGKTYVNAMDFKPVVYINDSTEPKQDADITTEVSGESVEYDAVSGQVVGKQAGITIFTVTYNDNGVLLSKTFKIEVIRPVERLETKIEYFSAYSGTLRDPADSFKEKTLVEYLYPNDPSVEIIDAFMGNAELSVENNGKVFGISYDSAGTCVQTIKIGTKTSMYIVDVTVYGQYVYEAKDLDVFRRSVSSKTYDGYVELGRDIDATNYTAGLHFTGDTHNTNNYPKAASGSTGVTYTYNSYYGGTFDGKGHTISNLKVSYNTVLTGNEKSVYGMFVALNGSTIKNVAFTNVDLLDVRAMFGFCGTNANFENVRIDVKNFAKYSPYQANLITYYALYGGSLKNMYVTFPSTLEINLADKAGAGTIAGALTAVAPHASYAKPTFENIVVVSKLPLGYSARFGVQTMIGYASNDTAEFKTGINKHFWARYSSSTAVINNVKTSWQKQADYDSSITDYRILERTTGRNQAYEGTYRFDTVALLKADANIGSVLSQFPAEYWTVNEGELVWGASQTAE